MSPILDTNFSLYSILLLFCEQNRGRRRSRSVDRHRGGGSTFWTLSQQDLGESEGAKAAGGSVRDRELMGRSEATTDLDHRATAPTSTLRELLLLIRTDQIALLCAQKRLKLSLAPAPVSVPRAPSSFIIKASRSSSEKINRRSCSEYP